MATLQENQQVIKNFKSNCFNPSYYVRNRGRKFPTSIRESKKRYKKTNLGRIQIINSNKVKLSRNHTHNGAVFKVYFSLK